MNDWEEMQMRESLTVNSDDLSACRFNSRCFFGHVTVIQPKSMVQILLAMKESHTHYMCVHVHSGSTPKPKHAQMELYVSLRLLAFKYFKARV